MCKFCQADTFTNWRTERKRCGGGGLMKCPQDFSSEIDPMLASALQPHQCSCITRYLDLGTCPCFLPSAKNALTRCYLFLAGVGGPSGHLVHCPLGVNLHPSTCYPLRPKYKHGACYLVPLPLSLLLVIRAWVSIQTKSCQCAPVPAYLVNKCLCSCGNFLFKTACVT